MGSLALAGVREREAKEQNDRSSCGPREDDETPIWRRLDENRLAHEEERSTSFNAFAFAKARSCGNGGFSGVGCRRRSGGGIQSRSRSAFFVGFNRFIAQTRRQERRRP